MKLFINRVLTNLKGKVNYISEIVQNYKDWHLIFFNRFFGIRTKKVQLRNGVTVVGGSRSLILDLIDEIFIKNVYNPTFMKIKAGDVVMDIGANIGVFSLYVAKQKAGKIYSVEPLFGNIELIKRNFNINKLNKPNVINVAVSDKVGIGKLYLGDLDSHGFLLNHGHKQKLSKYEEVKTMTLDKIFEIYKIEHLDFLKIDCEGGEGDIIKSTNVNIWRKINKVSIEYHDEVSTLSHLKMLMGLEKVGYKTKIKTTGKSLGYIYALRK